MHWRRYGQYAVQILGDQHPAKLKWPNGARIAFNNGLNTEHYEVDKPSNSILADRGLGLDPVNFGWRDYGVRVGIWHMIEALENCKMRASVLLNSDCCARYPEIIEAGKKRNWAWLAHGKNNSIFQTGMKIDDERKYLADAVQKLSSATAIKSKAGLDRRSPRLSKRRLS